MITIVDYGVGNIQAFLNVYHRLNIVARAVSRPDELRDAEKVILPGVGDFDHAMRELERSGMRPVLDGLVLERRVSVLGVCVGMQLLARSSQEGSLPGLGWIPGEVRSFRSTDAAKSLAVPHMGWNDVRPARTTGLFDQLADSRFYFLHSYYFHCDRREDTSATSSYGAEFASAVSAENIHGVQFHPEKSHHWGVRLLQNFAAL